MAQPGSSAEPVLQVASSRTLVTPRCASGRTPESRGRVGLWIDLWLSNRDNQVAGCISPTPRCQMMKTALLAIAAVLMGSGLAYAAPPTSYWGPPANSIVRHITEVETLWSDTNCGSAQAKLKAAVAPDFQGTSPRGMRYGRSMALGSGANRDCHLQQIKVHFFADSLAVVYGNESYMANKKDGPERKVCLAWTDTWLRRQGEWQIIAAQDNTVRCR